jgi:hypothetical protein
MRAIRVRTKSIPVIRTTGISSADFAVQPVLRELIISSSDWVLIDQNQHPHTDYSVFRVFQQQGYISGIDFFPGVALAAGATRSAICVILFPDRLHKVGSSEIEFGPAPLAHRPGNGSDRRMPIGRILGRIGLSPFLVDRGVNSLSST